MGNEFENFFSDLSKMDILSDRESQKKKVKSQYLSYRVIRKSKSNCDEFNDNSNQITIFQSVLLVLLNCTGISAI